MKRNPKFLTVQAVRQLYDIFGQSLDILKSWTEKIPGFNELCKEDQEVLFQASVLEIIILRNCLQVCLTLYIHRSRLRTAIEKKWFAFHLEISYWKLGFE